MSRDSALTLGLQLQTSLLGVKSLIRHVGLARALRIGAELSFQQATGAPFKSLPPPESKREKLSRSQIAPAILLYRSLRKFYSQNESLSICREIIVEGTLLFLSKAIGPIKQDAIKEMNENERAGWITHIANQFFNASIQWHDISEDLISFTVTRCRFPELCAEVGVPELAPLFCEGDQHFFNQPEHFVQLQRPHTIAEGARNCPFTLSSKTPNE